MSQLDADTDHMFHEPSDELPPETRRLMDLAGDDLIEDLAALGVHIDNRFLAATADPDEAMQVSLVLHGYVGDIAFSDEVLRPQVRDDLDVLGEIDDLAVADEYERTRRDLLGDHDG
jgi:hypothetical protein